jgi:hypothetical protein
MRIALVGGLALSAQLSCGGDSLPKCDTPDCTLPGSTIVKWKFNHYPELMFDSDSCSDLGVVNVRVEIEHVDDPTITESAEKSCGEGQHTFIDLPTGTYKVTLTPLDGSGESLVHEPVSKTGLAGSSGAPSEINLVVPYEAWVRSYTGQFLYRLSWDGKSCDAAMVVSQNLTLVAGGQLVTQRNNRGDAMNGSEDAPCWPLNEQFPQNVMDLPFGPATLLVVGKDASNEVVYEKEFDTFVGAGRFNPTFTFDVPSPAPPDAGVPDAGMDDAGMDDAGPE